MRLMMKCFTLLIVFIVISALTIVNVFAAENLALNKPVEASNWFKEAAQDESPERAVDGDEDTKWCARPQELLEGEDYHWIIVDLEEEKEIGSYIIKNASLCSIDSGKYNFNMIEYTIEVSLDKENWTEVDKQDFFGADYEDYEIIEIRFSQPVKARYVKLNAITPTESGDQTVRLPEFELYEFDPNATIEPTPTPSPTPEKTPTPPKTATPAQSASASPKATETNSSPLGGNLPLFIGIGAAVVIIAGVVIFILIKKKKAA